MILSEIIGSAVIAIVLTATLWVDHKKTTHQEKMDFAKFYDDFDTKLRDTDEKLREMTGSEHKKIYHYEIKIIVTLTHLIKFYEDEKIKFSIKYFQQWMRYGLALTYRFPTTIGKVKGDEEYIDQLQVFCEKMNDMMKEGEDWTKKPDSDLPDSVLIASGEKSESIKKA